MPDIQALLGLQGKWTRIGPIHAGPTMGYAQVRGGKVSSHFPL